LSSILLASPKLREFLEFSIMPPTVGPTRRELLDVETFDWGTLTWLANGQLMPGAAQTLGICRLNPGCGNPAHCHPNCEELLTMLSGRGLHRLGDETIELGPGMTLRIPTGVPHQFTCLGPEPIECLIAFSSGDRQTVFLD
jgi:mannose-6-phosphate isomerase-like protein (cupin superfamily)